MTEPVRYALLGRGRWGARLARILGAEGRPVLFVSDLRQRADESPSDQVGRLSEALRASGAQIAWICTLPGPHVTLLIEAAVRAGLDVLVEKPWYGSRAETVRLRDLARAHHRLIAVHYEYCVNSEVEKWRRDFYPGSGLSFGGCFFLGGADHTGIPAIDNLGSHLISIRRFAVPQASLSGVACGYQSPDQRLVWVEDSGKQIGAIDLLVQTEPIIQNFIKKVEAARGGAAFPFDLEFALEIAEELAPLSGRERP